MKGYDMYLLDKYINGKTIKIINDLLYHGLLINKHALDTRRLPWDNGTELICAMNAYGGPLVRMSSAKLLLPHTLTETIPKSNQVELRKVKVQRWYMVNDRQNFSHIYSDPLYAQDPDQYVDSYCRSAPSVDAPGLDYYELIATSIYDYATRAVTLAARSEDSHQYGYGYPKIINVSEEIILSQSVNRCEDGYLLSDDVFRNIIAHLEPEYYQWKYYS